MMHLILVSVLLESTQGLESANTIESRAKDARLAIKSGSATITLSMTTYHRVSNEGLPEKLPGGQTKRIDPQLIYKLSFKDGSLRNDSDKGVISIINPKEFLCYRQTPPGLNPSVEIQPRQNGLKGVMDFRVWGIAPSPFAVLRNYTLSDLLGRNDRAGSEVQIIDDPTAGKLTLITVKREGNRDYRYWIDPARGWNVVRAEFESPAPNKKSSIKDTLKCKLDKFGEIWFPSEVTCSRLLDNKLMFEETGKATDVRFNDERKDDEFSLSGMGLPVGTVLHDSSQKSGPWRVWKANSPAVDSKTKKNLP